MGTRTQSTCKDTKIIPNIRVIPGPTEDSMMNSNKGKFNAPSREAIYYRIHKLAYGTSWKYDYETFVSWDAKNR